ncbi:DUF3347 domain-containing protein [Pedobacter sp. N23S346]|uniref:DUF3347 domain-containing protein n=1 Tax=Pedobacter sp. N23S346 TaxID=3402750 RepID=UPI003AD1DE6C
MIRKYTLMLIASCFYLGALAQTSSKTEVATPELVAQRELTKKDVVESYLQIKQALIVSDSLKAASSATQFVNSLTKFKFKKLTLEEMNNATGTRAALKELAKIVSSTHNITKQRKAFVEMTDHFWKIADKVKPLNTPLFLQMCTMTGETWVSDQEKIENPVYPKNMLTCGMIKAKLD